MLTSANITRCHFQANKALYGGAIYVTTKSELKVYDSQFTMNTAWFGGSLVVVVAESLVESSVFASGNASLAGGCILFKVANGTVKQSHFSGCQSDTGGTVAVTEHATLLLETVMINKSYSSFEDGGAIYVFHKSNLVMTNSVIKGSRSEQDAGGIYCSDRSQMYLDSVLISSCSSPYYFGCVFSIRCSVTMNNITITEVSSYCAICASDSTINIYNTFAQINREVFLWADSPSHMSFWNFNMSGTSIHADSSVAEFRHTLFIRKDETCLIETRFASGSTVYFQVGLHHWSKEENRVPGYRNSGPWKCIR